jgi:hypothetical protein
MPVLATPFSLKPADVFAVRVSGAEEDIIEFGEGLMGKPNLDDHVAIMHHWDGLVPWGLEGRPGGVGWVDMRKYIGHPYTFNNCLQPGRTDAQRAEVATRAQSMLGTKYDWNAIADNVLKAFHAPELWARNFSGDKAEGQVICSSYAEYLYEVEGWSRPVTSDDRDTSPADWTNFIIVNNFNVTLEG